MQNNTEIEFKKIISTCREIFLRKTMDYGASWRIFRPSSITDQIYIKAKRIRSVQEKKVQKITDSIESEFVGIINYCIIALLILDLPAEDEFSINEILNPEISNLESLYNDKVEIIYDTLIAKNHDYGEAWRDLRMNSFIDLILVKILRIKQIEDHEGITTISEGVDNNYIDIVNYAVFAIIKSKL